MCPFELTAIPLTSPRYIFSGSLSGSGIESKLIFGGVCCCANAGAQSRVKSPKRQLRVQACMTFSISRLYRLTWSDAVSGQNPSAKPGRSESKPVKQVQPPSDDRHDNGLFGIVLDERRDEIDLIERHELENFAPHLPLAVARQRLDDLQALRPLSAEEIQQFLVARAAFGKGIEPGAGAAVGVGHDDRIAHIGMRF